MSMGFPTRFDTNRAVQLQKMARGLKIWIKDERDCTIYVVKKVLIKCVVTISKMQKAGIFVMQLTNN